MLLGCIFVVFFSWMLDGVSKTYSKGVQVADYLS